MPVSNMPASFLLESEMNPQEDVIFSPASSAPRLCATTLRRSWYSLTFSDDEDGESQGGLDRVIVSAACAATLQVSDTCSEASTDVGGDLMNDGEHDDDCEAEVELNSAIEHRQVQSQAAPSRPRFSKLSRQQRADQLQRVVEEFCAMDFDSVDASCQEGLVRRMMTTLKSLKESTIFHEGEKRLEETRFSLLGLGHADADVINEATGRAEKLCEGRLFRAAFALLKELQPRVRGEVLSASKHPSTEEAEAMAQRRLQKRLRQREERREQRTAAKRSTRC